MRSLHLLYWLAAAELLEDDCASGDCALSFLQRRQLGVSSCANQTECDSNRTCVFKEDKTWSQCVPLDDKTFQQECRFWDRKMRLAAINATKILCDSVKCEYDQERMRIGVYMALRPFDSKIAAVLPYSYRN